MNVVLNCNIDIAKMVPRVTVRSSIDLCYVDKIVSGQCLIATYEVYIDNFFTLLHCIGNFHKHLTL